MVARELAGWTNISLNSRALALSLFLALLAGVISDTLNLTSPTATPTDREVVEQIVARERARNYGFRSLVHEIVQSRMFLNK